MMPRSMGETLQSQTEITHEFKYHCVMCGRCCHEVPFVEDELSYKRIPLYPEEADRLEEFAENLGIELHLVEDLVFPDELNQQIIVVTWRIMLDNDAKVCPFHYPDQGCLIHDAEAVCLPVLSINPASRRCL